MIESLKTGPLNNPSYEYIIETFGDANNEVEKMAMQFFENWDKGKKKAELLDQYICSIDYTSERSLEEEIDKCKTICGYYGMDSEKYLKQLKKIIEKYKEIARTCDGICYDNSADLEIAKKEVEEFRDKTYALDANDEKKIQDVRNYIAENFKMHSKEKYLRFLDKALEDYDLRYRTVKDIVYETREEADKVKSEWDYLEDIRKATDYNSVDSLKNAMVKITEQNWTISADINYIEFFQNCLELYNEAKSIVANSNYTNREEQTEVALKIMLLNTKYEAIGVKNLEFEEFTDEFMNNFFEIMNKKCDSILSANTEYYKALEHAQSYFTNVVSKSTEKKFFFSKIVDGAKEMLAKGYVDEYNYFTNNGTSILPSDTKDNGKKVEEIVKSKLKNIENIKKEYELKHQEVGYRWKLGSKKVYGELILVDNAIVTKDFVCAVMKEVTKFHSPQHIPEFTEVLAVRDILEKKYRRFAPMTIEYSEETGGYLQEFLTEKEEFLFNVGDVVYIIKNANDGFFIEGGLEVMEVIGKKKPDFWKVKIKSNKKIEDIFKENIKSRVWVVGF